MQKNMLLNILSIVAVLMVTGCDNHDEKPTITVKECKTLFTYKYNLDENKFIKSNDYLLTYYFNKSSIPYVSLKDYAEHFLGPSPDNNSVGYAFQRNGDSGSIVLNNEKMSGKAIVNPDTQTLTYDTYSSFFTYLNECTYPLETIMTGGEYLFKDLKYEATKGKVFSIDLSKYSLKAYSDNEGVYLPYNVCITAFGNNRDNYVYTGNGYYHIDSSDNEETYLGIIKQARDSISNNAYNEEYQNYAYNHLAFTFDNYFGLDKRQRRTGNKEEYCFFKDGAYKALEKYKTQLLSTSPDVSNLALYQFYDECVNDGGHSNYNSCNLFSTKLINFKQTGETAYVDEAEKVLKQARDDALLAPEKFGKDFTGYVQTVNNVLFVTIDEFIQERASKKEDFSDEEYGKCAVTVIGKANEEVQKNSNIKNVVLDMSLNLGGQGFMPLEMLSWINKGNMNFTVKNNQDGTILKGSGHADVNLDGTFDSKDYLADDINIYVMCSPTSFSSGNYICCLASEVDGIKFIGDRSGGGSCNVAYMSNAFGSSMKTSGYIQLCFNKEDKGMLVSDEAGITPTYYPINLEDSKNASKFYDRQGIVNKILN